MVANIRGQKGARPYNCRARRHGYWQSVLRHRPRASVSAVDCDGRTICVAGAQRDDGKRFVVHADEKLTVFLEFESAIP